MSVQLAFDLAAIIDPASKRCSRCGTVKPLTAFRKAARYRGGVFCHCLECVKAMNRARYTTSEYRIQSRIRGATAEYRVAAWARRTRLRYGISQDDYAAMHARQGGVCGICGKTGERRLAVDHDHACCNGPARSCGKCLRALLCGACNRGVGWMEVNGIQNEYTDVWRLRIAREIPNPWDELLAA